MGCSVGGRFKGGVRGGSGRHSYWCLGFWAGEGGSTGGGILHRWMWLGVVGEIKKEGNHCNVNK